MFIINHIIYLLIYFFHLFYQFEQDILEACLFLLEKGEVAMTEWRDPVIVSRMISALVSHSHDIDIDSRFKIFICHIHDYIESI